MMSLREAAIQLVEQCSCAGAFEEGCDICKPFKVALGLVESTCEWCSGVGSFEQQHSCPFCDGKGTFKQNPQQLALLIRLWNWGKWQDESAIECQVTVMCENFQEDNRDLVLAMLKQALGLVETGKVLSKTRVQ